MADETPPSKFKEQLEGNLVWFTLTALVAGGLSALGAYFWLHSFVEEQINRKLADLELGVSEERVLEIIEGAQARAGGLTEDQTLALIAGQLEPFQPFKEMKGAIIAFDRSEDRGGGVAGGACPIGWTLFREAGGRMIVGAGSHQNTDGNGQRISDYDAYSDNPNEATGGAEKHVLELEEMPSHDHGGSTTGISAAKPGSGFWYDASTSSNYRANGFPFRGIESGLGMDNQTSHNHLITSQGESEPHNNMPPYIALYFCKKEVG